MHCMRLGSARVLHFHKLTNFLPLEKKFAPNMIHNVNFYQCRHGSKYIVSRWIDIHHRVFKAIRPAVRLPAIIRLYRISVQPEIVYALSCGYPQTVPVARRAAAALMASRTVVIHTTRLL